MMRKLASRRILKPKSFTVLMRSRRKVKYHKVKLNWMNLLSNEANRGENKRGKSCRFGSEATFYCSSGLKSKAIQSIDIKKLCDRMSAIEEHLESELASIRSILEKLTGISHPSSSHDASSSRVQPAVHDENFGNAMLNDANPDFGVDEDVGNCDDYGDC